MELVGRREMPKAPAIFRQQAGQTGADPRTDGVPKIRLAALWESVEICECGLAGEQFRDLGSLRRANQTTFGVAFA